MICRGIKHDLDRFINELSAKYLPFEWNKKMGLVQVAVRPLTMYEIVYPEPMHDSVCSTLFGKDVKGETQHKRHQKYINWIRRLLGIKKPEYKFVKNQMPVYGNNIEKVFIGQKKDRYQDGNEML